MEDYKLSKEFVPGLVSIIIPTHNRADIVCETIDSIFAQSYTKIELIVVDDNSTDDTEEVIKKKQIESKLYDFRYIKSDRKGGCAARNIGIIHCRGEYIQFFDDDDIMSENHIEKKVAAIGICDFVTCNFYYFEREVSNIVDEKCIHHIVHTAEGHLLTSSFPAPAFMCRRECIATLGFWNESIKRFQDISYFHRLFLYDKQGVFLSDKIFMVRIHSQNISSNNSEQFHQAMINAYDTVEKEWKNMGKASKLLVHIIYLLKFSISMQAVQRRIWKWGIGNIVRLSLFHPLLFWWVMRLMVYKMWNMLKGRTVTSYYFVYRISQDRKDN